MISLSSTFLSIEFFTLLHCLFTIKTTQAISELTGGSGKPLGSAPGPFLFSHWFFLLMFSQENIFLSTDDRRRLTPSQQRLQ